MFAELFSQLAGGRFSPHGYYGGSPYGYYGADPYGYYSVPAPQFGLSSLFGSVAGFFRDLFSPPPYYSAAPYFDPVPFERTGFDPGLSTAVPLDVPFHSIPLQGPIGRPSFDVPARALPDGLQQSFSIAGPDYTTPDKAMMSHAIQALYSHSPTFAAKIHELANQGIQVAVGRDLPYDGAYYFDERAIAINLEDSREGINLSPQEAHYRLMVLISEEVDHAYVDMTRGFPRNTEAQVLHEEALARIQTAQMLAEYSRNSGDMSLWPYLMWRDEEATLYTAYYNEYVQGRYAEAGYAMYDAFMNNRQLVGAYAPSMLPTIS